MSLTELEYKILSIDKSGVCRALTLFRDHHLVHVIEDGSGGVRYEICNSHDHDADDDQHLHFYCERCRRTYCLNEMPVPSVQLPDGFEPLTVTCTTAQEAVYVALLPTAEQRTFRFTVTDGSGNSYTGTAKATLTEGEYVEATGLKLTKQ